MNRIHQRPPSFLRCMGTPPYFSVIFTKGNNFLDFLVASLAKEFYPKGGPLLWERICSFRSKFFPIWVDHLLQKQLFPLRIGILSRVKFFPLRVNQGTNENWAVASPEWNSSIHFQTDWNSWIFHVNIVHVFVLWSICRTCILTASCWLQTIASIVS